MIPSEEEAKKLWDKYQLPKEKRIHVALVAKVAMEFAKKIAVNRELLLAAALLHDIDKAAKKLPGERHPDTAVRILLEEGMDEVAALVRTHPLHAILDPTISPKTMEEKILYLSDKMVKYDIVGIDQRFALWHAENLPKEATVLLDSTYPKVKALEKEMFSIAKISFALYTKG